MSSLLLKNTRYLDENFDIKEGNILIENEIIKKITTSDTSADNIIDINHNLIMPGFINMHTHTPMSLFRSMNDDKGLEAWLGEILKREGNLTANDVYVGTKIGILNYIKNGITTFGDMYYFPLAVAKACAEFQVNGIIGLGFAGNRENDEENILREIKEVNGLNLDYYFIVHSVYLRKKDDFNLIGKLAKEYKKIIFAHASETKTEVDNCKNSFGKTPIELLEEYGFFEQKSAIAHGVHLRDNDIQILKNSDTTIVSNPASNLKLGSGTCDLIKLKENNINISVATDGACSNNRLDMFREMYLASSLKKYDEGRCDLFSSKELIKMATINGAKAFGLSNVGLIKEGYKADMIEINLHSLNFIPHNNILNDLIYSAETEDILMTICKGKVLYRNGKFMQISDTALENLYNEAEQISNRLRG